MTRLPTCKIRIPGICAFVLHSLPSPDTVPVSLLSLLLFSIFHFDLSVVSAELFLHSHDENCFPEDFNHDDHDGIFCRYSAR
ncbi:hypothetical protein GPM53_001248 [Salmonella enterica]|nr:hypothetical protein [Salmonella enterica subsp. enterica serovar Takoradi]EDY4662745.1 hypothetical protein [Salmonella enterica]EDZ1349637.1 hypothetical protein [Salmonella enterica]EEJ0637648.1 hypothetical protein [Salmonella enterica]EEJ5077302.1 hypothetical protein [Salmonella enterica]